MGVSIRSTGSYVPDDVITNEHLQNRFGCDPEWILKQTGIRERRHAQPHQATSDLAFEAARRCLDKADVDPADVDLILVATVTPDMSFPSVACMLQDRLKLRCAALDIQAACAGFTYALVTAGAYLLAGACENALVIGADCMSRVINPQDVKIFPILGDGAGAVLLSRGRPDQGIVSYSLGSQGDGSALIQRRGCGSRHPATPDVLAQGWQYMSMEGRAVFNWAASILSDSIQDVLAASGLQTGDINLYVPHQANVRIVHAAIDVLKIDRDRVVINIDRFGNTSAASIPLALDEAVRDGRVEPGDRVILSGFGAGLVWGTMLFRW